MDSNASSSSSMDPNASSSSCMDLNAIRESIEELAKSNEEMRKLWNAKSNELIDQVSHDIEQAVASRQSGNDLTTVLTELKTRLRVIASENGLKLERPEDDLEEPENEVDTIPLDANEILFPDISMAFGDNINFDVHTVNQIIISHFYREGLFDVADCFIKEACETEPTSLKFQFQEIHEVLEALKAKNIEPAIDWLAAKGERVQKSKHMEKLQNILQNQLDPNIWKKLGEELFRAFCHVSGQPLRDPLNASVAAGGETLLSLLKRRAKSGQIPTEIDVELRKEFQFHSYFFCPVSTEDSNEENPAMMLPCGHCLCRKTINRMASDDEETEEEHPFTCPYCRRKVFASDCLRLHY